MVSRLWNRFTRGMWSLELQARGALEYCKQNFMDDSHGSSEAMQPVRGMVHVV